MTAEGRAVDAKLVPMSPELPEAVEAALMKGDLGGLSVENRIAYYKRTCESLGLNYMTKPFDYVEKGGKVSLYPNKDCAAQLRRMRKVSFTDSETTVKGDLLVVKIKATDKDGRTDVATGVVSMAGLAGEARANAIMKAETKAKRRATLSICGLGWADDSEIDSIPGAARVSEAWRPGDPSTPAIEAPEDLAKADAKRKEDWDRKKELRDRLTRFAAENWDGKVDAMLFEMGMTRLERLSLDDLEDLGGKLADGELPKEPRPASERPLTERQKWVIEKYEKTHGLEVLAKIQEKVAGDTKLLDMSEAQGDAMIAKLQAARPSPAQGKLPEGSANDPRWEGLPSYGKDSKKISWTACSGCGRPIRWTEDGSKKIPLDRDDERHYPRRCSENGGSE